MESHYTSKAIPQLQYWRRFGKSRCYKLFYINLLFTLKICYFTKMNRFLWDCRFLWESFLMGLWSFLFDVPSFTVMSLLPLLFSIKIISHMMCQKCYGVRKNKITICPPTHHLNTCFVIVAIYFAILQHSA